MSAVLTDKTVSGNVKTSKNTTDDAVYFCIKYFNMVQVALLENLSGYVLNHRCFLHRQHRFHVSKEIQKLKTFIVNFPPLLYRNFFSRN